VKKNNNSTILGVVLLLLFFLQFFLNLRWTWLVELQQDQLYKRWSGLGIALFIAFQWVLTFTRVLPRLRKHAIKMTEIHKWVGAISPVLFYIHSVGFGYGYLALLSYIFFTNTLIGYINLDVLKNSSDLLFKGWMILHVAFSFVITILLFFHVGVVFYYK